MRPGAQIGDYMIESRLSGDRYIGAHVALPQRVCITVMPAGVPWAFRRVAELDHPGIPKSFGHGMLPTGEPWIATEIIDGETLETHLARVTLGPRDAAALVRDIAAILDHAHRKAVLHGNLSAAAVVLPARTGVPLRLVDWRGSDTSAAADIYALGLLARQLLRGTLAPPVFLELTRRMLAPEASDRPSAHEVHDHAGWLLDQIALPEAPIDDMPPPFQHPITSEVAPNVSGEIRWRRR